MTEIVFAAEEILNILQTVLRGASFRFGKLNSVSIGLKVINARQT